MNEIKENRLITNLVINSFGILAILIVISITLNFCSFFYLFQLSIWHSIGKTAYAVYYLVFIVSGFNYLLWYDQISHNYSCLNGNASSQRKNWSFLVWFFPVVNIIFPFKKLNAIHDFYTKREVKNSKTKTFLKIWALAFTLWYIVLIIQFQNNPFFLFPEDEEFYYSLHRLQQLVNENSIFLMQLFGLLAMIKIVKNVQSLERKFIASKNELDISEHLIEDFE